MMDRTEIEVGMAVAYKEEHTGSAKWKDGMEEFVGEPFVVLGIEDSDNTALCSIIGLMVWLDIDWLEPYKEGERHGQN